MLLTLFEALALAAQCAPAVAPETLLAVVQVESGFDPLAIGVNGEPRLTVTAGSAGEAAAKASSLIAAGRSVDLGLAQINSRNLGWLGLTVTTAFDPCRNLTAAAQVLQVAYAQGDARIVGEQAALRTAFSLYNTGDRSRGFRNGYVTKVANAAARIVPAIEVETSPPRAPGDVVKASNATPAWDVFGQMASSSTFVLKISPAAFATPATDGSSK